MTEPETSWALAAIEREGGRGRNAAAVVCTCVGMRARNDPLRSTVGFPSSCSSERHHSHQTRAAAATLAATLTFRCDGISPTRPAAATTKQLLADRAGADVGVGLPAGLLLPHGLRRGAGPGEGGPARGGHPAAGPHGGDTAAGRHTVAQRPRQRRDRCVRVLEAAARARAVTEDKSDCRVSPFYG